MSRFTKNLIITTFLIIASFVAVNFSLAQGLDTGMSFGQQIGLSNTDPRIVVANVIRIALGFLGIIAVGLIMYAGWLYMTAAGEEEKIEQAKKLLISAVIGLVIILSSFAIASFIISKMLGAAGGISTEITTPGPGGGIIPGDGIVPGGGDPTVPVSCSDSDSACVANNTKCEEGYHCSASCVCEPGGGYGESCDSAPSSPSCEADNGLCSAYLTCDAGTCTCLGAPLIEWVSPIDESNTPNGKPGNIITIGGKYFGATKGTVTFMGGDGTSDDVTAIFPSAVNPSCTSTDDWDPKGKQIVVVVPAGAANGPVKVVRADGVEDTTANNRGPVINDFVVNNITRPGICKIDPIEGVMNSTINYYGLGLPGSVAYFGSALSKVVALNSTFNNNANGTAKVPNIGTGNTSTFVLNGGEFSNYLDFKKNAEPETGPKIDSFEPKEGAPGQYVTIHGSGFGAVRGANKVYFGTSADVNEAGYNFPTDCAESVWSDKQVIVKVPVQSGSAVNKITMAIGSKEISSGETFTTNTAPLTPSLCKIEPIAGPKGSTVSLWGEYFGDTAGLVRFNPSKDQTVITSWAKDTSAAGVQPYKVITTVPLEEAVTGPVQVVQGTASNGMDFTVGDCTAGGCGINSVCCPTDSSDAGKCKTGTNLGVCYTAVTSSVYEWEFSTGSSGGGGGSTCDSDTQTVCGTNSCCNSGDACSVGPDGKGTCGTINCSSLATCGTACCAACTGGACPISPCAVGQTVCGTSCCAGACVDASKNSCAGVVCSSPQITCGTECCAVGVAKCGADGKCSTVDRPGESCLAKNAPSTCNVYSGSCGANYGCMAFGKDTCGTCCCDASLPQSNPNGLVCAPDKSPCVGGNRGLYCGCEKDDACGSKETVGCAADTCCRTKPTVTGVYPETTDVCPNTLIYATFSEKMDISSFPGNIIVAGEYDGDCPDGTYLSLEKNIKNKNIFARTYGKIVGVFRKISGLFSGDSAFAEGPDPSHHYCAVTGIINGVNEADGKTKLTFSLNKALDANRKYYVIIKGDEDSDSKKGIISSWKIGLNVTDTATFGSKTFTKAKIWSFETGGNTAGKEDCKLNDVTVTPASYLFKEAGKTQSFLAEPHAKNGQIITPTSAYKWTWSWSSDDITTATIDGSDSPIQTVTSGNVQDKNTWIRAKANINTPAEVIEGKARVYMFLCANPWPPFYDGDKNWAPWNDTATNCGSGLAGDGCGGYNFGLYYCRDAGASGEDGDLPAIGNTIIRGRSDIQNILKETYFFRE